MTLADGIQMVTLHETQRLDGQTVELESQALRVRSAFGVLVWNRPVAVIAGGTRLLIPDITRRLQIIAYGFSLLCLALGLAAGGRTLKERVS